MKNILFILLSALLLLSSCDEDCDVGRSNYTFEVTIDGETRKAIIVKPVNECIEAPVLFYFHGRGGNAKNSQAYLQFHNVDLLDNMYIVYAEGTVYDGELEKGNGWVARFPHISTKCPDKNKDLEYLQAIINHLIANENADIENMGACGHSNGGFFTLSLAQLRAYTFKGFAAHGCYSSYAPVQNLIDCENSYVNAIDKSLATVSNSLIIPNPAPTLYMFGVSDSTLHSSVPRVYKEDCTEFSLFQNAVLQLCIKNKSEMPVCSQNNFMTTFTRQVFPATNGGAETQVHVHPGDHSMPADARQWIAEYFADLLYP